MNIHIFKLSGCKKNANFEKNNEKQKNYIFLKNEKNQNPGTKKNHAKKNEKREK